jgi:hypothetical protein
MSLRGDALPPKQSPREFRDCFGQEQERPRNDDEEEDY